MPPTLHSYRPEALRFALVSPLPLGEVIPLAATAFAPVAPLPSLPAIATATAAASPAAAAAARAARGDVASSTSLPFPDFGRTAGGAMAIERPGRRATLSLCWEVLVDSPANEARQKPLELLGHVLTSGHAHSLSTALRRCAPGPRHAMSSMHTRLTFAILPTPTFCIPDRDLAQPQPIAAGNRVRPDHHRKDGCEGRWLADLAARDHSS